MKKLLITIILISSFFSCKNESNNTDQTLVKKLETKKTDSITSKFEDQNNCSKYANLYAAMPHLDSYKSYTFGELECREEKEQSPFSVSLKSKYYSKFNSFEIYIFEVSGESAKIQLNNFNMAKSSFEDLTKIVGSNTFKSGLTIFENASINISESENENELSKAIYQATFKNKYAIWLGVNMLGKMDVVKIDTFVKEYLEAIDKKALN